MRQLWIILPLLLVGSVIGQTASDSPIEVTTKETKVTKKKSYPYALIAPTIAWELPAKLIKSKRNPKIGKNGNGCNLFNSAQREPVCTVHDKNYSNGGGIKSRFRADWDLFKGLWKQKGFKAKFMAMLMFTGVRTGGMWSYQYKK